MAVSLSPAPGRTVTEGTREGRFVFLLGVERVGRSEVVVLTVLPTVIGTVEQWRSVLMDLSSRWVLRLLSNGYGQVRVFAWDGSSWNQRGSSFSGTTVEGDGTGASMALNNNGTVIAYGQSTGYSTGFSIKTGRILVYVWSGSTWTQRGANIDGSNANEFFGGRVAISWDGTIVAGSASSYPTIGVNKGAVRVYVWSGTNWVQRGASVAGESNQDYFGSSLALSYDGNTFIAASPNRLSNTG